MNQIGFLRSRARRISRRIRDAISSVCLTVSPTRGDEEKKWSETALKYFRAPAL